MGSTGQLSAFLVFNSLAGCAARVFTTATETGDRVLWWGFVLATALNGVLAIQMALYWNKIDEKKEKVRLTSAVREKKLERVEVVGGAVKEPVRPTSPPGSAKRYVRKLD